MDVASSYNLGVVYSLYFLASLALTIWIARTLFRNGSVFLDDVYSHDPRMAGAVNRLLVVGFYLLNLGYALLTLREDRVSITAIDAMEVLAGKLGALMLALGTMHFVNMYVFHRLRRKSQIRLAPPPVRSQARLHQVDGHSVVAPEPATVGGQS